MMMDGRETVPPSGGVADCEGFGVRSEEGTEGWLGMEKGVKPVGGLTP